LHLRDRQLIISGAANKPTIISAINKAVEECDADLVETRLIRLIIKIIKKPLL